MASAAYPGQAAGQSPSLPAATISRPAPLFDFISLLCLVLLGYALLGKLFAYQGIGNFYIGEITLAVGLCALIASPQRWMILRSHHLLPLYALMIWGFVRTVPYLEQYGTNALRDAVIWGYGLFAILVASMIGTRADSLSRLLDSYSWFVRIFLVLAPVIWVLSAVAGVLTLVVDGRTVPILKGGDMMVHLVGAIAFIYLRIRRVPTAWLVLAPIVFAVSSNTRAGILSLGLSLTLLAILRPRTSKLVIVTAVFLAAITAAVAVDLRINVPGIKTEMSVDAVLKGASSIFTDTGIEQYDGTKRWRIMWWGRIVGYTWNGPYFWKGKGFGENIAFVDGVVARPSNPLRSPHNGHMTFLARGGVPGLAIWLVVQGMWAWGIFSRWREATRRGPESLGRVLLFLLIYWSAIIVNASFDVYLEGPMGGIWFWTIFGIGVGTMIAYDQMVRSDVSDRPATRLS